MSARTTYAYGQASPETVIVVDYGGPVRIYSAPRTDSDVVGKLEPGTVLYDGKKVIENGQQWFAFDRGFVWWREHRYGSKDPALLPLGKDCKRTRLLARLPRLRGYTYGRDVDLPPSVWAPDKVSNTGTKQIDCSSLTWACLDWIYKLGGPKQYLAHQLIHTSDPWSAIKAAVRHGQADDMGAGLPCYEGLYLVQTWLDPDALKGGHQFIFWSVGARDDRKVAVLEASSHPRIKSAPTWNKRKKATSVEPTYTKPIPEQYDTQYMWARLRGCGPLGLPFSSGAD